MVFFRAIGIFLGLKWEETYNWIEDTLYFCKVELLTVSITLSLGVLLFGLTAEQLWAEIISQVLLISLFVIGTYIGLKKTFLWLGSNWREAWTLARAKVNRR